MNNFSNYKIRLLPICLFLAVFLFYSPVLQSDFITWDDPEHLIENPLVHSLHYNNIKNIFSTTVNNTYIPLSILSFAIEYHFFKLNPFVYHLNNLLLHCGVVILIFFLAKRMGLTVKAAFLGALLFGLHPMHVESVAWVTERKDVLYALFYLLSLLFYCNYLDQRKKHAYFLSIIMGFLSILSKPMALSLPLILFIIDWVKKRNIDRSYFIDKIPFFLIIIPIAWITYSLNTRVIEINTLKSFLIWQWTAVFYIKKFIFPLHFVPFYHLPTPMSLFDIKILTTLCAAVILVISVIRFRSHKWYLFACLYYFLSIFFLFRFDDFIDSASIVSDRFMYLPSLGICLFIGHLLNQAIGFVSKSDLVRWRNIFMVSLLFLFLGLKSFKQCMIWKNSITFWNYVSAHSKPFDLIFLNRALAYAAKKEYRLAQIDYNKAIEINPSLSTAYYSRGCLMDELNLFNSAIADYTKAIELDPTLSSAYNNRGAVYLDMGQYKKALLDFDAAIELNPKYKHVYINKAMGLMGLNRRDQALENAKKALEMDRDNKQAQKLLDFLLINNRSN